MGKRKVGERAKILFDEIDSDILTLLSDFKNYPEGIKVLQLAKELKINHNSLKPHIDKLMYLGIIEYKEVKNGEMSLISKINLNRGLRTNNPELQLFLDLEHNLHFALLKTKKLIGLNELKKLFKIDLRNEEEKIKKDLDKLYKELKI